MSKYIRDNSEQTAAEEVREEEIFEGRRKDQREREKPVREREGKVMFPFWISHGVEVTCVSLSGQWDLSFFFHFPQCKQQNV